jgi:hypothetical protein
MNAKDSSDKTRRAAKKSSLRPEPGRGGGHVNTASVEAASPKGALTRDEVVRRLAALDRVVPGQ